MNNHPKHITTLIIMMAALILLTGKKLLYSNSSLTLTSSSFKSGGVIPQRFTCDGQDISPALSWKLKSSKPANSYVLIVDDPDAQKVVGKTFVHWIAVLSPTTTELLEGVSSSINTVDPHAAILMNDASTSQYSGPCPPAQSSEHTYRFTLFALDQSIEDMKKEIKTVINADDFNTGMKESIIASARITGRYERSKR